MAFAPASANTGSPLILPLRAWQPAVETAVFEPQPAMRMRSTRAHPLPLAGVPDLTAVYYDADGRDKARRGTVEHRFLPTHMPNAEPVFLMVDPSLAMELHWGGAYTLKIRNGHLDEAPQYIGKPMSVRPVSAMFADSVDQMRVRTSATLRPLAFARPAEAQLAVESLEETSLWHTAVSARNVQALPATLELHSVVHTQTGKLFAYGLPKMLGSSAAPAPGKRTIVH